MNFKFNYIAITNNFKLAEQLDRAGVQQIMVDLENIGKSDRQKSTNAVINYHQVSDIVRIKSHVNKAKIICRINGFYAGTFNEIDSAIEAGADSIMIPMIRNLNDFTAIVEYVGERVKILPLIETPYSLLKIDEILSICKPEQIHFGLNDLSIGFGLSNIFEIFLSKPFKDIVLSCAEKLDIVGVGGVGNMHHKYTISPEYILNEHKLMGSNCVILSRAFFSKDMDDYFIKDSIKAIEDIVLSDYSEVKSVYLYNQINQAVCLKTT